jgi:ribosome-associated translation inhibitor RaiA
MRTEVRVHGIELSDELRANVHREAERLAQALRRRINTITVDLYDEPGAVPRGHGARCQVNVLFDDGSRLDLVDEEDDCYRSVTEAFVKVLCERRRHSSHSHT